MFRRFCLFLLVATLILAGGIVIAQDDDAGDTCMAIVQRAMEITAANCEGTGRNQVCYGNVLIDASASEDADDFDFDEAGDITDISSVASMRLSSSVDGTAFEWGIATMYVQANLPDSSPENLQIVLFGSVSVENAGFGYEVPISERPLQFPDAEANDAPTEEVEPTATPSPSPTPEPTRLEVTSTGNLNLRGGPSTNNAVVGSLTAGQVVTAEGRNEAGDWLLLDVDGEAAWVFAPLVTVDGDIMTLDVVDSTPATTTTNTDTGNTETIGELAGADITTLEPMQVVEGELSFTEPSRSYTFFAEEGQRVRIRLESIDGEQVYLLGIDRKIGDEFKRVISVADEISRSHTYISGAEVPETGEYRVTASLVPSEVFEGARAYRIIMQLLPPPEFVSTQGFFIDTEREDQPCGEAIDSGVLIQTPEGEGEVAIVVNEVVIDLGSTAYIRTTDTAIIAGVLEGEGNVSSSNGASVNVPAGAEIVIPFVGASVGNYGPEDIQPYDAESFDALPLESLDRQITPAPPWNGILAGPWFLSYLTDVFNCPGGYGMAYSSGNRFVSRNNDGSLTIQPFQDPLIAIPVSEDTFVATQGFYRPSEYIVINYEYNVISASEIQGTETSVWYMADPGFCLMSVEFTMSYVGP